MWVEEGKPGKFNTHWLETNGFGGLSVWSQKHISLAELATGSPEVKKDFGKRIFFYTPESASAKLKEAHRVWVAQGRQGLFNTAWLQTNGYGGLYDWARKNISLQELASKFSEVEKDFKKQHRLMHKNKKYSQ